LALIQTLAAHKDISAIMVSWTTASTDARTAIVIAVDGAADQYSPIAHPKRSSAKL
jgi:hypothetical protein